MPIAHHSFNTLSLLTLIHVILITCCFSQEKIEKKNKIDFEIHSGYFVSNKFEPKNPQSFIITSDQEFFDSAFGIAFVQGDKSNRLKEGSLKAKIVISTIKRGSFFCDYDVVSLTNNRGKLELRYNLKKRESSTAEYSCPLIVSIPKIDYKSVKFIENGKLIKNLK